MPIYAYRCAACGHSKDVLQKMSDPVLTVCPNCGADEFRKQVTAAGFQLKGSGWYVTDFRGGAKPNGEGGGGDKKPDAAPTDAKNADSTPAPAAKTDSPAAAPAAGSTPSAAPASPPAAGTK